MMLLRVSYLEFSQIYNIVNALKPGNHESECQDIKFAIQANIKHSKIIVL